jgi:hypothetical protein
MEFVKFVRSTENAQNHLGKNQGVLVACVEYVIYAFSSERLSKLYSLQLNKIFHWLTRKFGCRLRGEELFLCETFSDFRIHFCKVDPMLIEDINNVCDIDQYMWIAPQIYFAGRCLRLLDPHRPGLGERMM